MFQSHVNYQQAPAVSGDFASNNPRASVVPSEGAFVAGSNGVVVGRFAWIGADGRTVSNTGTGAPDGFVHREQQALITTYLAEASNTVPQGFPVTLMRTGDYWILNSGTTAATKGQKAFASLTDGSVQFANAGATVSGYVETPFVCSVGANPGELAVISA